VLSAENGFSSVTIAELVAKAGVGKPTFYEQFDSKEECFVAYLDASVHVLIDSIGSRLDPEGSLESRIHYGLSGLIDFVAEDPNRARAILIEAPIAGPRGLERINDMHDLLASFYISLREESRAVNPELPELSRVRAQSIVGAIYEPVVAALRENRVEDIRELRDELVDAVTLLAAGHHAD
jgi:AcrR family transcriptional regulator